MALFGGRKAEPPRITTPLEIKWARTRSGAFPYLKDIDPAEMGIQGVGGVFVLWHAGVRPAWVYAGESPSLARALDAAKDNRDITQYHVNGGLFATWAAVPEDMRRGILLFLTRALAPLVVNPRAPTEETEHTKSIPVVLPGSKKPAG